MATLPVLVSGAAAVLLLALVALAVARDREGTVSHHHVVRDEGERARLVAVDDGDPEPDPAGATDPAGDDRPARE